MPIATEKLVIVIVGYPGCGKSYACQLLAHEGFYVHRPSDVLRTYAKAHGLELKGRQDYIDAHHRLNQENPLAIVEPVIASAQSKICIDGLRAPVLLDTLRQELDHVRVVALDCPIEERFRRTRADALRSGHRARATLEDFQADELPDYINPDRNLPNMQEMMSRADYTIDASQPPSEVARQLLTIANGLPASS